MEALIQCDKVKVIVILFSCSSDFALYLEECFMDKCVTWNIVSVRHHNKCRSP